MGNLARYIATRPNLPLRRPSPPPALSRAEDRAMQSGNRQNGTATLLLSRSALKCKSEHVHLISGRLPARRAQQARGAAGEGARHRAGERDTRQWHRARGRLGKAPAVYYLNQVL